MESKRLTQRLHWGKLTLLRAEFEGLKHSLPSDDVSVAVCSAYREATLNFAAKTQRFNEFIASVGIEPPVVSFAEGISSPACVIPQWLECNNAEAGMDFKKLTFQ